MAALKSSDRKEFWGKRTPELLWGTPREKTNEAIKGATRLDLRQAKYRASVCSQSPIMAARSLSMAFHEFNQLRVLAGDHDSRELCLFNTCARGMPVCTVCVLEGTANGAEPR